jgi:serine protease Do
MKWPPNRGYQNQDIQGNSYLNRSISFSTSQAAKIIFCFICTGMFLSGDGDRLNKTAVSASPQQLAHKITQVAADVSVRILNQDFLGSGFIVQRTDHEYFVITNQHVLRAGESPYSVETADGSTYTAEVVTETAVSKDQYDLAILKFKADTEYQTATLGNSWRLEVGESVFAAGFPAQDSSFPQTSSIFAQSRPPSTRKLTLKSGRVAIILNQALAEGYQIGYTNDVKKGMSGGPLFNAQGEVIGVNGKHAYPLWESPEIYQDGSEPCPALQDLITRLSLAIPIEKTINLTTQFNSLKSPIELADPTPQANLSAAEAQLIAKMRAEAEKTQLECRSEDNATLRF